MNFSALLRVAGLAGPGLILLSRYLELPSVGAFLAIAYFGLLPGLALLSGSVRRWRLSILIAAMIVSLPLATLGFALTRMADLPPSASAWALMIPVVLLSILGKPRAPVRVSRADCALLGAASGCGLLLFLALDHPGILASWHGFFHAAVTEQILNHGVPPDNPGLAGETLNFYWAFHVFVALITALSDANPLTVIAAVNAFMLTMTLLVAYQSARVFLPRTGPRLLAAALTLGAINTGAGLVLLAKFLRHGRVPGDEYSDGRWIDWLSQRAIPGRLWDGRASSVIKEYYDISGMAAGMTLLFAYMWLWFEGPRRWKAWFPPLIAANLLTLFLWYPPLAMPALAHAALAATWMIFQKARRTTAARLLLSSALIDVPALIIAAFYYQSITDATGWLERGEPFLRVHVSAATLLASVAPFWAILPCMLLGAVNLLRRPMDSGAHLAVCALLLLAFAAGTDLQQNTQYKFYYALALPAAIVGAVGAAVVVEAMSWLRPHSMAVYAFLVLLAIHPALVFAFGAATSRQAQDTSLTLEGRNLVDQQDPARMACLAWIRDHAPRDAVLLLPLLVHERSPSNPGFRDAALAQRGAWLVYDAYHSRRFKTYEARARLTADVFEQDVPLVLDESETLKEQGPVYAVISPARATSLGDSWRLAWQGNGWAVTSYWPSSKEP